MGQQYWQIVPPRMLPTGELLDWLDDVPHFTQEQDVSVHCPMAEDVRVGQPFRGAVISHPSLGWDVVYEVDDAFGHWYFWNDLGGKRFFCAEPLTWMSNAMNMNMPAEVSGVASLDPGASWSAGTVLRVVKSDK